MAIWLGGAGSAAAAPWRFGPGLKNDEIAARLAERYPDIHSAADLEGLLKDIGRRLPLTRLEAKLVGGTWVLTGEMAQLVTDIDLALVTRELKQPVYAAIQSELGQIDAPETRQKTVAVVQAMMRRRGYYDSQVQLDATQSPTGAAYDVKITEGDPCIIAHIDLGVALPKGARLGVREGDLCDRDDIETAVGNLETELRGHGFNEVKLEVADLSYDRASGSDTVKIVGVLGQRVRYEIIDSTHRFLIDDLFGDDELTKIDPVSVAPDALVAELSRRYANRGFVDAKITGPEVVRGADNAVTYICHIDPGKQYVLSNVQFEGVTVFKQEELLDTMGLSSLWQTSRPYNYEEIQQGLTALRGRYQSAGYWDAKIRDPGTGQRDKETGTVRLTIQVEEGSPRWLNSVTVTGNHAMASSEIVTMLGVQPRTPLDRSRLVDFQKQLREAYESLGYLYFDVAITLQATKDHHVIMVNVNVAVTEGPRVTIGDVSIVGLVRTQEKVVRRELLFHHGEWYDPDKIKKSRDALTRLGLFRSVQIVPADRSSVQERDKEMDLVIDLREGKAGNVAFGPGWSLITGWNYTAEATYNNLGGVGRTVSVRGSISEERDQYAIGPNTLFGRKIGAGYVEPYFLDLPVDLSLKASQEAQWANQLWELTDGGEIALTHKLNWLLPGSSVSAFYGQKIAKSEGTQLDLANQVASDERIGQVGVRSTIDSRDNVKFPTDGYVINLEFDWARYDLGGDVRYFRWDIGGSYYVGLMANLVLAMNVDLTSYTDIDRKGTDVDVLPSPERLASGGPDTVRGFPLDTLGPVVHLPVAYSKDANGKCQVSYVTQPLNGTSRTTIKTELRRKMSESFAVTGFVDAGNSWLSPSQLTQFQRAYKTIQDPSGNTDCTSARTVADNFNYSYSSVLQHPRLLWTEQYYSYGSSLNFLTALGSVNLAYGLPWREPTTQACKDDATQCNIREHQTNPWIKRGEFILNVGARF